MQGSSSMECDMEIDEENPSITIWKIENYSYCSLTVDECIRSKAFPICFDVKAVGYWRLELYPRGVSGSEDFISVCLERILSESDNEVPEFLTVDYKISILDCDGTPKCTTEEKDCNLAKGEICEVPRLMLRVDIMEDKSTFLPEDTLTVRCCVNSKWMKKFIPFYNLVKSRIYLVRHLALLYGGEFNRDTLPERGIFKEFKLHLSISLEMDYDSMYIIINKTYNDTRVYRYRIGILDSTQSTSQFLVDVFIFPGETRMVRTYLESRAKLLRYNDLYLPDGRLTLYCEVHITTEVCIDQIESQANQKLFLPTLLGKKENSNVGSRCCADNYDSLKNDFQNLYQEGTFSDFSIQVGDETLRVHKAVLSARSPVFKAVLGNRQENWMDLSNIGMDIVRRMLVFMYTDKADGLNWEAAKELYITAGVYEVKMLKRVCLEFLKLNVRSANVQDISELASRFRDGNLERLASEFLQRRN